MPRGIDEKGRPTDGFGGDTDLMEGISDNKSLPSKSKNGKSRPTSKELRKLCGRNGSPSQSEEDANPSRSNDEVK